MSRLLVTRISSGLKNKLLGEKINPTLEKYFPDNKKPSTFFPLSGKTVDMIWYVDFSSNIYCFVFQFFLLKKNI